MLRADTIKGYSLQSALEPTDAPERDPPAPAVTPEVEVLTFGGLEFDL